MVRIASPCVRLAALARIARSARSVRARMARIVRLIRMVRANAGHVALALALALAPGLLQPAHAAGFAVIASPARFEIAAQAGETVRQVLELSNVATEEVRLELRSADWSFDPDSNVVFHEALQADSCRPWVALEKRAIDRKSVV